MVGMVGRRKIIKTNTKFFNLKLLAQEGMVHGYITHGEALRRD